MMKVHMFFQMAMMGFHRLCWQYQNSLLLQNHFKTMDEAILLRTNVCYISMMMLRQWLEKALLKVHILCGTLVRHGHEQLWHFIGIFSWTDMHWFYLYIFFQVWQLSKHRILSNFWDFLWSAIKIYVMKFELLTSSFCRMVASLIL